METAVPAFSLQLGTGGGKRWNLKSLLSDRSVLVAEVERL